MSLFGKFFDNKKTQAVAFASSAEQLGEPLPLPTIIRRRSILAGKHTLEKHFGDIHQARPPKKAQLWQACDEQGVACSLALTEPGEGNREWLTARLGKIKVLQWRKIKAKGPLQKFGTQLLLCIFETVVADRYIIKKCLSSDPIQETYEAWDSEKKCPVYCTIYLPQKAVPLPRQFVAREKKPAAIHPRFLEVLDEGLAKPHGQFAVYRYKFPALYYVITRYVPAVTFAAFVDSHKRRVRPEHLCFIIHQIGDILAALQQADMLHGHVRPQTLWIGSETEGMGQVYLNGFSALAAQGDEESTAAYMRDHCLKNVYPLYLAPEQIATDVSDARSDYFSLGVVIQQLVSGRSLFYSKDHREVLRKIARWQSSAELPLPKDYRWLQIALAKLLHPDRQQRPGDWKEFLAALQESYLKIGTEPETSEDLVVAASLPDKPQKKGDPSAKAAIDEDMEFEDMLDTGKDEAGDEVGEFEDVLDTGKDEAGDAVGEFEDFEDIIDTQLGVSQSETPAVKQKPAAPVKKSKRQARNESKEVAPPLDSPLHAESERQPPPAAKESSPGKSESTPTLAKSKSKLGQALSIFRRLISSEKREAAPPPPPEVSEEKEVAPPPEVSPEVASDDEVWEEITPAVDKPARVVDKPPAVADKAAAPVAEKTAPVAKEIAAEEIAAAVAKPTASVAESAWDEEDIEDLSNEELINLAVEEPRQSDDVIVVPPPGKQSTKSAFTAKIDTDKKKLVISRIGPGKKSAPKIATPAADEQEKEALWEEISPPREVTTARLEQMLVDSFDDSETFVIDEELTELSRPKVMPVATPPVAESISPELQAQIEAMDAEEELDYLDSQEIFLREMQQKKSETQKQQQPSEVKSLPPAASAAKPAKKNKSGKSEKVAGTKKKKDKLATSPGIRPGASEEEEDFEWEKEFEVVSNSLSQWEDTDEEDIIGSDGANNKENS